MQRRDFLKFSMMTGAGSLVGNSLLAQMAHAAAGAQANKNVVVIFLRGGMDVLSLLPAFDGRTNLLNPFRANIQVGYNQSFLPYAKAKFRVHESMLSLKPLIDRGELAFLLHTASVNKTRSHFMQQDLMETGDGVRVQPNGYLGRAGQALEILNPSNTRIGRGVALGTQGQKSLRGGELVVVNDFADIEGILKATSNGRTIASTPLSRKDRLELANENCKNETMCVQIDSAARNYDELAQMVKPKDISNAEYAGHKKMLAESDFFRHMGMAADVVKSGFLANFLTVDLGSFDSHKGLDHSSEGQLGRLMLELAYGIKLFQSRLSTAQWKDTAIVVMSEFGRTVRSNNSLGTDHGAGSAMMVIGGNVQAKASAHYNRNGWDLNSFEDVLGPNVNAANAGGSAALDRKIDYRHVLNDVLVNHLGLAQKQVVGPNKVFSEVGLDTRPLNLFRSRS